MLSSAPSIAPKPAVMPPPTSQFPPTNPGSAGTAPSFAQFLNEQPDMMAPPPHTDPVSREPDAAPEPAANAAPAANTVRRPQTPAPKPTTPVQKSAAEAAAATQASTAKDAVAGKDGEDKTVAKDEAADEPETASLDELTQIICMATPDGAAPVATEPALAGQGGHAGGHSGHHAPAGDDAEGDKKDRAVVADAGSSKEPAERRADTSSRPTDTPQQRGKGIELAPDRIAAHGAARTESLQAAAAAPAASTPQATIAPVAGTPNFAAMLAAQAAPMVAATGDGVTAPGTAHGQIHAAVNSNAFGAELGARVSLLAVDGLQHAELQLNPADMGPVAVQIVVDGSQAQVSFHAVQAETRQALEQSLPDLAAALQGQGLTLSGGGVFQQKPRDPGNSSESGNDEGSNRTSRVGGSSRIGGAAGSTAQAPVRRTVGLLDTFA